MMIILKIALMIVISFCAGALMAGFIRRNFNFEVEVLSPTPLKTQNQPAPMQSEIKTERIAPFFEPEPKIEFTQQAQPIEVPDEIEVVAEPQKPVKKSSTKAKKTPIIPEVVKADITQVSEVKETSEMKRPVGLFAPRDDAADDLKLIKGIGPTNERKLNQIGIYHYDQIANWTAGEAEWINSFLEFPGRVDREDWIAQAKKMVG